MAKFKKALALVLSLAMVLTLAPIANVNAAAKYKISAKTTALAAGKTYNVKVTGVTKNQYVKVARTSGLTVKYSGKTIKASKKVAGTGKALTFKVTAPGKEKAYNATIKVTIYNKKTNKKVKTLSTKRKIKALPVEELKISSVEPGTAAGATYKFIIVKFNQKFSSLAPSEIQIRRVSDGQLYTVEKVVLDADGKGATLTLLGETTTGTTWLAGNVPYTMTITQGTKIASKEFTLPVVADEEVVVAASAKDKTITLDLSGLMTIGSDVTVDYNDILGRTVTAVYDRNHVVTKLTVLDETVLYSAFKGVDTNNDGVMDAIQDIKTEKNYPLVGATVGSIYATGETKIDTNDGGRVTNTARSNTVEYAKVTLNGNGSVRHVVSIADFNAVVYVASVKDTDLINIAGGTQTLKDYTILKGGKTVAITDIVAGDVVYVDTVYKIADVFSTDTVKGKLAVYTGKFQVGDTRYDTSSGATVAVSVVADKADTAATDAVLGKYADTEVTVFFNRMGKPQKVVANDAVAETTSVTGILMDDAKAYNEGSAHFIDVSVNAGEGTKTYKIDLSKVKSIRSSAGALDELNGTTKAKFEFDSLNSSNFTVKIDTLSDAGGVTTNDLVDSTGTDMKKGNLITLTSKTDGTIVGFELGGTKTAAKVATPDIYFGTGTLADYISQVGPTATTFKSGANSITSAVGGVTGILGKSTPVLIYNSADKTVKKITYGDVDFTFTIAGTSVATSVGLVRFAADTVGYIVIDAVKAGIAVESKTVKAGVLVDYTLDTSTVKKFKDVTIAYNGSKETIKDFANEVLVTDKQTTARNTVAGGASLTEADWYNSTATPKNVAIGQVAFVSQTEDGKITGISQYTTALTAITFANKDRDTYTLDSTGSKKLVAAYDTTLPYTIVTVSADGTTVKPISWTDYCLLSASDVTAVDALAYSGNYYDVVIVTLAAAAAAPAPATNGLEITMASGTPIAAVGTTLKKMDSTQDLEVIPTGFSVVDSVEWYQAANATASYVKMAGETDLVLATASTTAGKCYYAVVTDSNGNKHNSEKVQVVAPTLTSYSLSAASTASNALTSNSALAAALIAKDQFGQTLATGVEVLNTADMTRDANNTALAANVGVTITTTNAGNTTLILTVSNTTSTGTGNKFTYELTTGQTLTAEVTTASGAVDGVDTTAKFKLSISAVA